MMPIPSLSAGPSAANAESDSGSFLDFIFGGGGNRGIIVGDSGAGAGPNWILIAAAGLLIWLLLRRK